MSRYWNCLLLFPLLAALAGAQQKTSAPHQPARSTAGTNLPSEETVNAFMQAMFGYDSSLSFKVVDIRPASAEGLAEVTVVISGPQGPQPNKFFVTADGQHAVTGEIIPFGARPFEAARKELESRMNGPSRGPKDAPITIVEFSDLQCPHCKEAAPKIDELLSDEKNVRFVLQSFPLPAHDWANKAAAYADCVGRTSNDAFWKFMQATYDAQTDITAANADEKLTAIADGAGVKGADIAACSTKPETTTRVEQSVALGKDLEVNSTPTIFINGRKVGIGGLPYDLLKKLVEFQPK